MKETFFRQRSLSESEGKLGRMAQGLASIYRQRDGGSREFTRLTHPQRGRGRGVWLGLFVLGLVAAVWFFSAGSPAKFGEEAVELSLLGPSTLKAGEVGTWRVAWRNGSAANLQNVDLTLVRGSPLLVKSVRPSVPEPQSERWAVEDLKIGQTGGLEFDGLLWGEPGAAVTLEVRLAFTPEQWGARFSRRATRRTTIVESVLSTEIDGPTQIIGGGERTYTIRIHNSAPEPVSGVRVTIVPPGTFTVATSSPDIEEIAGTLAANALTVPGREALELTVTGSYVERSALSLLAANEWTAETSVRPERLREDVRQHATRLSVAFVQGDVLLTTLVGGKNETQNIDLGSTLVIASSIKNEGASALEDVALSVDIAPTSAQAGALLDWARASLGTGKRIDNRVVFSSAPSGEFGHLPTKSVEQVRVEIPLVSTLDPTLGALGDIAFDVKVVATVGKTGEVVEPRELTSNVVRVRLNSDLAVFSRARYFSEENLALGSGPLPPRAGSPTTLRVFWKVTNTLHELSGVALGATLAEGVVWTGNAHLSAGTIRFDSLTREIRWSVNRMPGSVPLLEADFELSVTPTDRDVGFPMALIKKTVFQAEDSVTRAVLSRSLENLNTNLAGDPFAAGKGVVTR